MRQRLLRTSFAALAFMIGTAGLIVVDAGVASASTDATSVTLVANPTIPAAGNAVTLTATVTDTATHGPVIVTGGTDTNAADGVVTFYLDTDNNGSDALCSVSGEVLTFGASSTGTNVTQAICSATLPSGSHTIYADYTDSGPNSTDPALGSDPSTTTYGASSVNSGAGQAITVAGTLTTSAVSVSPTNPVVNVPATITDTITPQVSGSGSVTFYDDVDGNVSDVLCSTVSLTNISGGSQATCQTTWVSANSHTVYADYTGNATFSSSSASVGASVGLTSLGQALFANANQPGAWVIPSLSQGNGFTSGPAPAGCLTAGSTSAGAPIPGCALGGSADADGHGFLRLTPNSTHQVGSTLYGASFPTSAGLDIKFNTYQWDGSTPGADGIGFSLIAVNPSNPTTPTTTGPVGGSLGYSDNQDGPAAGEPNGYLGFGLDAFGNSQYTQYEGYDQGDGSPEDGQCQAHDLGSGATTPNTVDVKGPGALDTAYHLWLDGYCIIGTSAKPPSAFNGYSQSSAGLPLGDVLDDALATTRPSTPVTVEIVINSNAGSTLTPSGWSSSVPASGWGMKVTPIVVSNAGATTRPGLPIYETGALPNDQYLATNDSSWVNAQGIPKQLVLGWTASTGANTEIHEIGVFHSTTANGTAPALSVTNVDNQSGVFQANDTTGDESYFVTPSVPSTSAAETSPISVAVNFPNGSLIPKSSTTTPTGDPSGTGWTCGDPTSGPPYTVLCTYPASSGTPIEPGTQLPKITIPVQTVGAAGVYPITATASSADAASATATDDVVVGAADTTSTSVTGTAPALAVNASETFTSTVVSPTGGSGTVDATTTANPTSTVEFFNGNPNSGGTALNCSGSADGVVVTAGTSTSSCTASFPAAGTYTIYAKYNGDATYAPSLTRTSPVEIYTVVVSAASTTTAITSSPATLNTNQSGQIVALVTGPVDSTATNSASTVTFYNGDPAHGGTPLVCTGTGDGTVNAGSQSTCTTSFPTTGTYTIYAKYSGDSNFATSTSGPVDILVGAAVATQIALSGSYTQPAGTVTSSNVVTATLEDGSGNPTTSASSTTITLSGSDGTTATTFGLTSGVPHGSSIPSVAIPAGQTSVTFNFADTKAGTLTITGTSSFPSATVNETITAATASQLVLSGSYTQTAGNVTSSNVVTATSEDQFGNIANVASNTTVTLIGSDGTTATTFGATSGVVHASSISSVQINSGTSSATFNFGDTKAGTLTITGSALASSPTVNETITAGIAAQLAYTNAPISELFGTSTGSPPLTVQLQDTFGNAVNAGGGGLAVTMSAAPLGGTKVFASSSGVADGSGTTAYTIPSGSNSFSFHYGDTVTGTPTLTATSSPLTPAMQTETITALPASQIVLSGSYTQAAGSVTTANTVTASLEDSLGDPIAASSNVVITLTGSDGATATTFGATPGVLHSSGITTVQINSGSSSTTFNFGDTKAGTLTISGASSYPNATVNETITAGAAARLAYTNAAISELFGTSTGSPTLTVQLQDTFGNPVNAGVGGLAVTMSSNSAGTMVMATSSGVADGSGTTSYTIPNGSNSFSFHYGDTAVGAPTLMAASSPLTPATQAETITAVTATPTSIIAIATPATSPVGTIVQLSATGLPSTATGTITFTSGGSVLCSYTLGSASSCPTTSALPAGLYPVTAAYSGDANNDPSTAQTSFTLTPAAPPEQAVTVVGVPVTVPIPGVSGVITISSQPATDEGVCTVSSGGAVLFTPAAGYVGVTTCDYTVTVNGVTSPPAVVTVTVNPLGAAKLPTPQGASKPTAFDTSASTLPGHIVDVPVPTAHGKAPFTYRLVSTPPSNIGTWTFSRAGLLQFYPYPSIMGVVAFTYTATDTAGALSNVAKITIHIGSSGTAIPGTHTGEPWSGPLYWLLSVMSLLGGMALLVLRRRRVAG